MTQGEDPELAILLMNPKKMHVYRVHVQEDSANRFEAMMNVNGFKCVKLHEEMQTKITISLDRVIREGK